MSAGPMPTPRTAVGPAPVRPGAAGPAGGTALLRNGYALMANTAVTAVLGLGYWVLAARLFPPSAVGAGSAAVSALLFVAGVSQLNLMGAITRFLPVAGRHSAALLGGAYATAAAAAVVLGTAAVATARWWAPADSPLLASPWFGAAFVGAAVAWCLFVIQDSALTAVGRAVWVPVENGLFGLAKLGLLVGLAGGSAAAVFASWTLPAAIAVVPVTWLLFGRLIPAHAAAQPATTPLLSPRALARFVGGDYAGSVFAQALLTLMPLLVVALLGSVEGARFYVPWVIVTTIDLLAGNLATSLIVESARDEGRLAEMAATVVRRALSLVVPLAAVTVVLAPLVLVPFGAGYASESATTLRLLGLATVPRALSTLYVGVCRAQRRVGCIAAVQAGQAVLVLGAAAVLVPAAGLAGAGAASLVGQVVVALFVVPRLLEATRARPLEAADQ
ncbi:MAG: teichoic acid transporter [Actinomycetota bacterium]